MKVGELPVGTAIKPLGSEVLIITQQLDEYGLTACHVKGRGIAAPAIPQTAEVRENDLGYFDILDF